MVRKANQKMTISAISSPPNQRVSVASLLLLQVLCSLQLLRHADGYNVLSNRVVPICEQGCHCFGSDGNCPAFPTVTDGMISAYKTLNLINPIDIKCDPFQSTTCAPTLENGEACVVELIPPDKTNATSSCPDEYSYRLTTVEKINDAIESGQYITHTGACGSCSSLQDLALMIEYPDLSYKAQQCFFRSSGVRNLEIAISCYQEVGFTTSCSTTLAYYQKRIVDRDCGFQCAAWGYDGDLGRPSCDDVSGCGACLDEVGISARLELIGGRTFANSGYPSQKAQQCVDITSVNIIGGSDICTQAQVEQSPIETPTTTLVPSSSPAVPVVPSPIQIDTSAPVEPTMGPVALVEPTMGPVAPVEPTMGPVAPVEPTMEPVALVTSSPTTPQSPTLDVFVQQCLSMAAIEVRAGALSGGGGVVCDCTEAQTGATNRPRCFSSVDRTADTQCGIVYDTCMLDTDCCGSGARKCRLGSCRPVFRGGGRDSLRLSGDRGGAARGNRGVVRTTADRYPSNIDRNTRERQ